MAFSSSSSSSFLSSSFHPSCLFSPRPYHQPHRQHHPQPHQFILLPFSSHHYYCHSHPSLLLPPSTIITTRWKRKSNKSSYVVRATKNGNDNFSPADRIISAACYLYPFLDGVQYGKYVVAQFPAFQVVLTPLYPFIRLFHSFPLNGLLIFLALYFAVVRNPSTFSRYVRFNTMQAIVLDVLLIFPDLIERSFNPRNGVGLEVLMSLESTVFLYLLVCLVYGSASCIIGQVPRLPLVADAADRQVM